MQLNLRVYTKAGHCIMAQPFGEPISEQLCTKVILKYITWRVAFSELRN